MSRKLHRRIGVSVAVFLLLFVATGVLIQHAARLHLDRSYLSAGLTHALYGLKVFESTDIKTKNHWVSHAGLLLYLDGKPVNSVELSELYGAVESQSHLWVLGDDQLWLLMKSGAIVDQLSVLDGLPGKARRIGRDHTGRVVIGGAHGNWAANERLDRWQAHSGEQVAWSSAEESVQAPWPMKQAVLEHASAHLISWERLLLDLHSGRLFGPVGVVIADAASLLLLFLIATGLILWARRPI